MPPKSKKDDPHAVGRTTPPPHITISFRQVYNLMWGDYAKYQLLIVFCQAFHSKHSAELRKTIETYWVGHPGVRMWAYLSAGRRRGVTSEGWPDQAREHQTPYDCLYFNYGTKEQACNIRTQDH
jgi:hypothetical protein